MPKCIACHRSFSRAKFNDHDCPLRNRRRKTIGDETFRGGHPIVRMPEMVKVILNGSEDTSNAN